MTIRQTATQFFRNLSDVFKPEQEQPKTQLVARPAFAGRAEYTARPETSFNSDHNNELIHEAILREQYKTKGQFILDMKATTGEDRTKFMSEFCNRNGIKYHP